jgi:hypothetical protein
MALKRELWIHPSTLVCAKFTSNYGLTPKSSGSPWDWKIIMARGQRIVVKFTQDSLDALHAALMAHAERLNSLLKPSWPDAEKVHEAMYNMVDTLMIHAVDQKWFSACAKIGRMEEMVTSQEIRVVS